MPQMRTTRIFKETLQAWVGGKRRCLHEGGTAASKCLGRGTRIVMANLTLKPVEDIAVGDCLMGIDSKPRQVLRLYSGRDQLFRIKQARGIDYVVSSNHILSVRENWHEIRKTVRLTELGVKPRQQKRIYAGARHTNEVINISLPEYLTKSAKWKRRHKGWKLAGVELKERDVKIEPYFLGLWLGDGTSGEASITNSDAPVIDYLKWFAVRSDLRYVKSKSDLYGHRLSKKTGRSHSLWASLRHYGILDNKRIPQDYLNNSKAVRLELLAGLVDSDGYHSAGRNSIIITQTRKELAEDILLLVRSLGCYTTFNHRKSHMKRKDGTIYEGAYYAIEFVGEVLNQLPVKLERKKVCCSPLPRRYSSSLEIEPIGEGDYFGFEIAGDHLFLLEDFTVAHNTWSILQALILIAQEAIEPLLISVVSESLPHLKRGAIRDFFNILGESQDTNPYFNKTECMYARPEWKGKIEFFGADDASKVRGPRRDILFINEGNNIPWETARGLDIRTSRFTIVDWNPVSEFWAHEFWLNEPENAYIHSTYLDARPILPAQVVADIEVYRDKDPNWWNVYGLGRLGKIEGLVHPYFEQVDELPKGNKIYGLDFGFSDDPATLVACVIIGEKLYSKELIYQTGLTNDVLARNMDLLGVRQNYDEIFADSAEPKSIEEIYLKGFNIKPCEKGQGSVEYGIQKVNQYKQFWTKDSLNCIKEQRNFRYIPDKDGKLTEKTTHKWSHGLDARRYAISSYRFTRRGIEPVAVSNFRLR